MDLVRNERCGSCISFGTKSRPLDRLSGHENIPCNSMCFFSARKRNKAAGSLVYCQQSILIVMLVVREAQKHFEVRDGSSQAIFSPRSVFTDPPRFLSKGEQDTMIVLREKSRISGKRFDDARGHCRNGTVPATN